MHNASSILRIKILPGGLDGSGRDRPFTAGHKATILASVWVDEDVEAYHFPSLWFYFAEDVDDPDWMLIDYLGTGLSNGEVKDFHVSFTLPESNVQAVRVAFRIGGNNPRWPLHLHNQNPCSTLSSDTDDLVFTVNVIEPGDPTFVPTVTPTASPIVPVCENSVCEMGETDTCTADW